MQEKKDKGQTLQEMFGELDTLIQNMEGGDLSLEESFAAYSKGMDILKQCNASIDRIEKKVLALDEEGKEHEFE